MFDYTTAAGRLIIKDFKKISQVIRVVYLVFTLGYFVYVLIAQTGNFWANLAFSILFLGYMVLDLISFKIKVNLAKKIVQKIYKYGRLTMSAITLGGNLYAMYLATSDTSSITIIISTLLIILWVLQVLLEVVIMVLEPRIKCLYAGVLKDISPVVNVLNVKNVVMGDESIDLHLNEYQKELAILEKDVIQVKASRKLHRKEVWSNRLVSFKKVMTPQNVGELKEKIVHAIDQNGNNEIDVMDFLALGLSVPGTGIKKDYFVREVLLNNGYSTKTADIAVKKNLFKAGISMDEVNEIAKKVIVNDTAKASVYSGALGLVSNPASVPADLALYFSQTLKTMQKLLYLYGADSLFENDKVKAHEMNMVVIALGAMFGVTGAAQTLTTITQKATSGLMKKASKKISKVLVSSKTIQEIAKKLSISLSDDLLKTLLPKIVPVVGAAANVVLMNVSFKPCCDRLNKALNDAQIQTKALVKAK